MNNWDKTDLRKAASRLFKCEETSAMKDMLSILQECLFTIFMNDKTDACSNREDEAKLVIQMIFTKLLHLKVSLEGVSYQSRQGKILNTIIDPTSIAPLVRGVFETVVAFSFLNNTTEDKEKQLILYNLWVLASLKTRQGYSLKLRLQESVKKKEVEAIEIFRLTSEIENTEFYKQLSKKGKEIIHRKINSYDFKIDLDTNPIKSLSWSTAAVTIGIREELMGDMYPYFSLFAHPSNFAVMAFADLFKPMQDNFTHTSIFLLKSTAMLVSFFIAEYIKLFPSAKASFESLPLIEQIAINFHLGMIQIDRMTINNTLDELD